MFMNKKDVEGVGYPFSVLAPPLFAFCVLGSSLGVLPCPCRCGFAVFFRGVFSWLFLFLVLLLSLVLRWLFLPFAGVLRLVLSSLCLPAVLPLCVVSALLLRCFLVVSCGVRWFRLVTLVRLWSLASLALGLPPLPRVRLALVRSGLTVLLPPPSLPPSPLGAFLFLPKPLVVAL